jgi:hypothetical protein
MKKLVLIMSLPLIILQSCSKEEPVNPIVVSNYQEIEYMPLKIGNYWIYETIQIDSLGNETPISVIDSAYIDRDTLINGKIYFVISGSYNVNHILGKYIRNNGSEIISVKSTGIDRTLFSPKNPGVVYQTDTFYSFPYSFEALTRTNLNLVLKNVGAGSYNCYNGYTLITQFIPIGVVWSKTENRYYEKSVGLVAGQYWYYSSPYVYEMRLIRYHLN